ncbi:MAG TPA: response regulator transcription factor [Bryobacteraceae bacterium]
MIRVLIAARSAMTRAGLETLVASAPGLQLAGSYPDAAAAEALHPDVLLAEGALEDLPPLAARAPAIVLLSSEAQPAFTHEAFKLGVRAVLARDASPGAILAAVEAAAGGLAVIEPGELEPLLAASVPAPVSIAAAALTARELDVLRLVAEGDANKEIAWKLGISEHTAKFHVASILGKLSAGSRTEAVTIGIRRGLVLI